MTLLRCGLAVLIGAVSGGCAVPISPLAGDPYPSALVRELRGADRESVRAALGEPAATRAEGEFWFYTQRRLVPAPIGKWTGVFPERWEWLGVMFDPGGRVLFAEPSETERGCLSNGICNRSGGAVLKAAPASAVITAPLHHDAEAKAYVVRGDECAVYFYAEAGALGPASVPARLDVDGRLHAVADEATYLFLTRAPGSMRLSAGPLEFTLKCEPGQALHVAAREPRPHAGATLSLVSTTQGGAAVGVRRLALPL